MPHEEELLKEDDTLEVDARAEASVMDDSVNSKMFANKLSTYNGMYRTNINAERFVSLVQDAWNLLSDGDEEKSVDGKKILRELFGETLKQAFDIEKDVSYEEQRLPDYVEIVKSTNDLLRASMFSFTELYRDGKKAYLFEPTAFGGMEEEEMAALTAEVGIWSGDQRSDAAWETQSKASRRMAEQWLREEDPYAKMMADVDHLIAARNAELLDNKTAYNILAAAEQLLRDQESYMVAPSEDGAERTPNWGDPYWNALSLARETLGIPKHISMRELIQGDYAEMKKTVANVFYNRLQISAQLLDPEQRSLHDSMEKQKEEFAIQREGIATSQVSNEQNLRAFEVDAVRMQITVKECDERQLMMDAPKTAIPEQQKVATAGLN